MRILMAMCTTRRLSQIYNGKVLFKSCMRLSSLASLVISIQMEGTHTVLVRKLRAKPCEPYLLRNHERFLATVGTSDLAEPLALQKEGAKGGFGIPDLPSEELKCRMHHVKFGIDSTICKLY